MNGGNRRVVAVSIIAMVLYHPIMTRNRRHTIGIILLLGTAISLVAQIRYMVAPFENDQDSRRSTVEPNPRVSLKTLLPRKCVSFRFRGSEEIFTLEQATAYLRNTPTNHPVQIGIHFAEDVSKFLPVRIRMASNNTYHMYHFVEMVVMSFAALNQVQGAHNVTWLFSPHASRNEFCGGPSNINCLIADLVYHSSPASTFRDHSAVIGLDQMDEYRFDPLHFKDKAIEYRIEAAKHAYSDDARFSHADGMMTIERFGCNNGGINKPWHIFIDTFPADLWHQSIQAGLDRLDESVDDIYIQDQAKTKVVACYIDRQNTDRRLHDDHHAWLVETLETNPSILFRPLHMEEYTALEQIKKASRCDLMAGMHGNGLTHLLWMKPGSFVIEFFWKYNFQYDYATAAQLLQHRYLAIFNGRVLNETLIQQRDPILRLLPTRKEAQHEPLIDLMENFERYGKAAILKLLAEAIETKRGSTRSQ